MKAYICLGANLGHPRKQIYQALRLLQADSRIGLLRESSVIRTAPYGRTDQPDFWNQVVEVETLYPPRELMRRLLEIEQELGRVRVTKWGPRTIDLDILLMEDLVLDGGDLTLPHPDFHNRRFALELLCEIDPGLKHPVYGKTVSQLLSGLDDKEK